MYLSLGTPGTWGGFAGAVPAGPVPVSAVPEQELVTVREFRAPRLLWWFLKGEQYLIHLPIFVLNMAFDSNVTKNLLWSNSRPHSCVWNFTFPACRAWVLHSVRDHSGHWVSDRPWLLSPLLVAAVGSPELSPEGHRYLFINLSHFWEGMALMLCWGPCVFSGWNQDIATITKREKNPFP